MIINTLCTYSTNSNKIRTFSVDIPPQIDLSSKAVFSRSSPGKSPAKTSNTLPYRKQCKT